jgi:hypothetical protein
VRDDRLEILIEDPLEAGAIAAQRNGTRGRVQRRGKLAGSRGGRERNDGESSAHRILLSAGILRPIRNHEGHDSVLFVNFVVKEGGAR